MLETSNGPLPDDLGEMVEAELGSDERVIWIEQPSPSRHAWIALPTMLYGISFTAFLVFAVGSATRFQMPDIQNGRYLLILFLVPLLLGNFAMISLPFWLCFRAMRTVYVITNHRILILIRNFWGNVSVRSFEPGRLRGLRRVQRTDGSGDLFFGREYTGSGRGQTRMTEIGFIGVPDARVAETQLRTLLRDTSASAPEV